MKQIINNASQNDVYSTNMIAIKTGDVIHFKKYENDVWFGCANDNNIGKVSTGNKKNDDNINKAKFKLRDIINSNVGHCSKGNRDVFLTMTYKENMKDIDVGKKDFKKFIMRWDYQRKKDLGEKWEKLKYVYVVEFQKRGAVHFHCIFFNLEYTSAIKISKLWKGKNNDTGRGSIKINQIDHVDNVGAYVVKYMQKDLIDDRLINKDLYGRSKGNLKVPIKITRPKEVVTLLERYKNKIIFSSSFTNEYTGLVIYHQVNLKRLSNSNDIQSRDFYDNLLKNKINSPVSTEYNVI